MFLFSELYTQVVEQNTGLSHAQSTFVGSSGSGFTTGALAGIAEYRKKLLSQDMVTKEEARWDRLFKTAKKHNQLPMLRRRLITAGICSATYDCIFFGTEVTLREQYQLSPALTYGGAAVCAVIAAFAFDTSVARMMVIPPQHPCLNLRGTLRQIFQFDNAVEKAKGLAGTMSRVATGYRGLSARAVEFFINYSITGATSVYIIMAFSHFKGDGSGGDSSKKEAKEQA